MNNYINDNELMLTRIEDFFALLDTLEEQLKNKINDLEDYFKQFDEKLSYHNRGTKRFYMNSSNYKKGKLMLERMNKIIESLKRIRESYEEEIPLITKEDYDNLIMTLAIFNNDTDENIVDFTKEFLKTFILISKEKNPGIKFLEFFDEYGDVKIDTCNDLVYYINNVYKVLKSEGLIRINEEDFLDIIVSNEDIETANREEQLRREQEQLKRQELKKKLAEEKAKKKAMTSVTVATKSPEREKYIPDPRLIRAKEYYDFSSRGLKPDCFKKISLPEPIELLQPFFEDKNQYNKCIEDYNKQIIDNRLIIVKRVIRSECRDLDRVLNSTDEDNIAKMQFDEFISGDNFDTLSDSRIKEVVLPLIRQMIAPNENIVNFIVFPTNEFVKEQKDKINNARTHANTDTIIKSAATQLKALQSNSLEYLRSTLQSAFHELQDTVANPFVIDGKLKGYRFGPKKAKTCLFVISVNPENQRVLQQMYNWSSNSKVLLVFGISNVDIENEYSFYTDIIKYSLDNKERLLEIYDIFANPFTQETLSKAMELIQNGANEIKNFSASRML